MVLGHDCLCSAGGLAARQRSAGRFTGWSTGTAGVPPVAGRKPASALQTEAAGALWAIHTHVSLTLSMISWRHLRCQWRLIPSHLYCKYMHDVDSSPWKPQTVFFQQMFEKQSFTNAVKHTWALLEYLFAFSAFLYYFFYSWGKKNLSFIHVWHSNKSLSCASLVSAEFNAKESTGIFFLKWIIY